MRPQTLAAMAAGMLAAAAGQYVYTPIDDGMRAVANSLIAASTVNLTSIWDRLAYATDTFGPRFSGTQGLESALDWIRDTARGDGLTVIEEPVMVPTWVRGNEWARLVSPRNTSLHFVGLGGSISTGGGVIQGQVFVVTSFADLTANCSTAAGKIVLFNVPFTTYGQTVAYRGGGAVAAAQCNATAALVRSVTPYSMQTPHTGGSTPASIPTGAVTIEDATMLSRMQARGQAPVVQLYMEAHTLADSPSRNLIIEIPGATLPNEYVVVGGHSDSWDIANGAMDDGGGSFASWEAARLINLLGIQPKRTLRFVFWVNEENGARGGQAYATDYNSTLASTSIAIESDEGAFSPYQLTFSGHEAAYNQLTMLADLLTPLGAAGVSFVSGATGTDVAPMCNAGVPCGGLEVKDFRATAYPNNPCLAFIDPATAEANAAVTGQISNSYFFFHHTSADTIDRMDPNQLQAVAASLAVWAVTIGNLPSLLPRSGDVPPLPPPNHELPIGVVVGIVCGGMGVLLVAVGLLFYARRQRIWCYQPKRYSRSGPAPGEEPRRKLTLVEQLGSAYSRDDSFVPMYHSA